MVRRSRGDVSGEPQANPYDAALRECAAAERALAAVITGSGMDHRAALRDTAAGRRFLAAKLAVYELTRPLVRGAVIDAEAAIAFLAAPVACAGLCWTRWRLLHRLKQAPLSDAQARRLRELALSLCVSREAGYCLQALAAMRRLMIRLATPELVLALAELVGSADEQAARRARALLAAIQRHGSSPSPDPSR